VCVVEGRLARAGETDEDGALDGHRGIVAGECRSAAGAPGSWLLEYASRRTL
jgi:hypothetical protein